MRTEQELAVRDSWHSRLPLCCSLPLIPGVLQADGSPDDQWVHVEHPADEAPGTPAGSPVWETAAVIDLTTRAVRETRAVSPAAMGERGRGNRRRSPFTGPDRRRISPARGRTPERGERTGQPGSRRHRRYLNEQYLLKNKELMDDEELKQALNVDRVDPSPWIYDSAESEAAWDSFCAAPEDEQNSMLDDRNSHRRRGLHMDRASRQLLKVHLSTSYGRFVVDRLVHFTYNMDTRRMVLPLPGDDQSSMHRKVIHLVARYYGHKSSSRSGFGGDPKKHAVVVTKGPAPDGVCRNWQEFLELVGGNSQTLPGSF